MSDETEWYHMMREYANERRQKNREQGIAELEALPKDKYKVEELQPSQFLVNDKFLVYPIKGSIVIRKGSRSVQYVRGKLLEKLDQLSAPVESWKLVWMVNNQIKETIRAKGNYGELQGLLKTKQPNYRYGKLKILPAT